MRGSVRQMETPSMSLLLSIECQQNLQSAPVQMIDVFEIDPHVATRLRSTQRGLSEVHGGHPVSRSLDVDGSAALAGFSCWFGRACFLRFVFSFTAI